MPIAEIQMPDGRIGQFEVPDGTSPDEVIAFAQQHLMPPEPSTPEPQATAADYASPTQPPVTGTLPKGAEIGTRMAGELPPENTTWDSVTKQWGDVGQGAKVGLTDPSFGLAQVLARAAGNEGASRVLDVKSKLRENAANVSGESRAGRVLGNLAITAPVMAAVPPGASALARTAIGAATGGVNAAVQPVIPQEGKTFAEQKAKQIGMGVLAGGVAAGVPALGSKMVGADRREAVKILADSGVNPTPGQLAGGMVNSTEQKAISIPGVGDVVQGARRNAVEQFNLGAINSRVLGPIGEKLPSGTSAGHDAIAAASDLVSNAYDKALANTTFSPSLKFGQAMGQVYQVAQNKLPTGQFKAFAGEVSDIFSTTAQPGQPITAEAAKEALSKLGYESASFRASLDPTQRKIGLMFEAVRQALSDELRGALPAGQRALYDAADKSYANLLRVQGAAVRSGSPDGVFSPQALLSTTRALDRSLRKGAFAKGQATMQDYASAGVKVLGPTVPDSGTAGRAALVNLGLLGASGGGLAAGLLNPYTATGLAALGASYTRPGISVLSNAMRGASTAGNAAAPYGPLAGGTAGLFVGQNQGTR